MMLQCWFKILQYTLDEGRFHKEDNYASTSLSVRGYLFMMVKLTIFFHLFLLVGG